jgi:activating signal cointegrator 1
MSELRAITIWQPWAQAIVCGFKRYETRSWATRYRGPILIHAAGKWTPKEMRVHEVGTYHLCLAYGTNDSRIHRFATEMSLSAAVALAELVDCHKAESLNMPIDDFFDDRDVVNSLERFFGDFTPGRYAWQLENVRPLTPVQCPGKQGLWIPSPEIHDKVAEQLRHVA